MYFFGGVYGGTEVLSVGWISGSGMICCFWDAWCGCEYMASTGWLFCITGSFRVI